jgi:probable rRNA maturation factor
VEVPHHRLVLIGNDMEITVMNRQRRVPVNLTWLRTFAKEAVPGCLSESGDGKFALRQLEAVEVAIVSDAVIARVHHDFMSIPGATDVITFEHGEIVASAETARRYAKEHGHSTSEELALYIVHGLLHLNGFDDREPGARKKMHAAQHRIWSAVRKRVGAPRKSG